MSPKIATKRQQFGYFHATISVPLSRQEVENGVLLSKGRGWRSFTFSLNVSVGYCQAWRSESRIFPKSNTLVECGEDLHFRGFFKCVTQLENCMLQIGSVIQQEAVVFWMMQARTARCLHVHYEALLFKLRLLHLTADIDFDCMRKTRLLRDTVPTAVPRVDTLVSNRQETENGTNGARCSSSPTMHVDLLNGRTISANPLTLSVT